MEFNQFRVFVDTNVFIAGLYSNTGASSVILHLGEMERILIVISQQVLEEIDRVTALKFPESIERNRLFLKNLSPLLVDDPSRSEVQEAAKIIDAGDAAILAAAKSVSINYLITLDTKHFHTQKVRDYLKIPVLKPAEFLEVFRKFFEEENQ